MPKVNNDNTRTTSIDVILVSTLQLQFVIKHLQYQNSISLLAFSTDFSVASIVCLAV